jgi:hypothetical protein
MGWMLCGKRWVARCVEIAAADGGCWGIAARRVVAENRSSKLMAADPGVSAASPRYWACCGCRGRGRAAEAQRGAWQRRSGVGCVWGGAVVLTLPQLPESGSEI